MQEVKTYRITCDGETRCDHRGPESVVEQCAATMPEMKATALSGLFLDVRGRGWLVVDPGSRKPVKFYCPRHHSRGESKPYPGPVVCHGELEDR